MTTHIELFTGSLSDLERMTGKHYAAMTKKNGKLLILEKRIPIPHSADCLTDFESILRESAKQCKADALVHVQYLIFPDYTYLRGYAVQQSNVAHEPFGIGV